MLQEMHTEGQADLAIMLEKVLQLRSQFGGTSGPTKNNIRPLSIKCVRADLDCFLMLYSL